MKRKPIWLLAGCLAVGSFSGTLIAEDRNQNTNDKNQTQLKDTATSIQLIRAKELIGKSVKNEEGKDIGTIKDIVVDSKQGRIAYAVLQFGGFLGLGEKQFAIPFRALSEDAARKNLILNVKKEQLEASRGFESGKWPDMADETWARDTHKHYGYDAYWEDRDGANQPKHEDPKRDPSKDPSVKDPSVKDPAQTSRPELNREHFWVNRLSETFGKPVTNSSNEDLGKVADVMIDMKHGRIAYVVLTDGGTLGIDESLTAVPLGALQCEPEKKRFTLNMSKDALKAYSFKENAWPNMADVHWSRKTHEGFKQQPYWDVYGFGGDDLDANWRSGSDYNKAFDVTKSRTINGKVTSIMEYSPAKDSAKGRLIVVKNDAGETFTVHLGPTSYLDRKDAKLMIKEGDTVTINSATGTFEGREAFQARDIRVGTGDTYQLRDSSGRPMWESRDNNKRPTTDDSTTPKNPAP